MSEQRPCTIPNGYEQTRIVLLFTPLPRYSEHFDGRDESPGLKPDEGTRNKHFNTSYVQGTCLIHHGHSTLEGELVKHRINAHERS